jgi:hypothetical protein
MFSHSAGVAPQTSAGLGFLPNPHRKENVEKDPAFTMGNERGTRRHAAGEWIPKTGR